MLRRERPPQQVTALLDRDERVLAWADTANSVVLLTPRGIWWPTGEGHRRIGWERIDKAIWRDGTITVTEADVVDDLLLVDRPALTQVVTKPRDLPPTLRKRVEASIVHTEVIAVPGGAARIVGRKIPGRDGVTWWARLETGTRDSAMARASIQARIDQLRAVWTPP